MATDVPIPLAYQVKVVYGTLIISVTETTKKQNVQDKYLKKASESFSRAS